MLVKECSIVKKIRYQEEICSLRKLIESRKKTQTSLKQSSGQDHQLITAFKFIAKETRIQTLTTTKKSNSSKIQDKTAELT